MLFNPHKLGVHKVLQNIPLNAVFDAPYKAALKKAVNIADLRAIAKSRAHKVRSIHAISYDKIEIHQPPLLQRAPAQPQRKAVKSLSLSLIRTERRESLL